MRWSLVRMRDGKVMGYFADRDVASATALALAEKGETGVYEVQPLQALPGKPPPGADVVNDVGLILSLRFTVAGRPDVVVPEMELGLILTTMLSCGMLFVQEPISRTLMGPEEIDLRHVPGEGWVLQQNHLSSKATRQLLNIHAKRTQQN